MAAVTIRNLSDVTHEALKVRARINGRSTEAEIRDILEKAAQPEAPIRSKDGSGLGLRLMEIGQVFGGVDLEAKRSGSPYKPPAFE